jgi:WD40 repeat protein
MPLIKFKLQLGWPIIATASTDSTVRLWDVEAGKPVGKPLTGNGFILSTAFSPDGHLLAAGAHGV